MSSLFDIRGKTALVTGGVHGLGRMIAEGLLAAGAKVYVTTRNTEAVTVSSPEFESLKEAVLLSADLSTAESASELARTLAAHEKSLHILVNNAGKTWGAPLSTFPNHAWQTVLAVNLQTPFTLVRDLLPLLEAGACPEDPARVINIGSVAGSAVERIDAYSYSASKAALHHLSRLLAVELADRHITVNTIVPGYFATRMTAHLRADDVTSADLLKRIPLGRLGEPDDIKGACLYLCSRAGRYTTGTELRTDGGLTCR